MKCINKDCNTKFHYFSPISPAINKPNRIGNLNDCDYVICLGCMPLLPIGWYNRIIKNPAIWKNRVNWFFNDLNIKVIKLNYLFDYDPPINSSLRQYESILMDEIMNIKNDFWKHADSPKWWLHIKKNCLRKYQEEGIEITRRMFAESLKNEQKTCE